MPKKARLTPFLPCQYPAERALLALAMFAFVVVDAAKRSKVDLC
jgi:hypothetical protein